MLWLLLVSLFTAWVEGISPRGHHIANVDTLVQVQVLFRHGTRYGLGPILTDPDDQKVPAHMWGQLMDSGKKEMFDLGQYLRNRYRGFVSEHYHREEVYALSSESERAIQSGMATLMGFYKEYVGSAAWDPSYDKAIEWIPLKTLPYEHDRMLRMWEKCPVKETNFKMPADQFPMWKEFYANETIKQATVLAGYPDLIRSNRSTFDISWDFGVIQDNISVKKATGQRIPDWAEHLWKIPAFRLFKDLLFLQELEIEGQTKLLAGPLLEYVLKNMDKKLHGLKDAKKMIFLSAHDYTLIYLLGALQMFEINDDQGVPPFGSTVMIELHRNIELKKHFVQVWFRNDTSLPPYELKNSRCKDPCDLETFVSIAQENIPKNWVAMCHGRPDTETGDMCHSGSDTLKNFATLLVLLSIVLLR